MTGPKRLLSSLAALSVLVGSGAGLYIKVQVDDLNLSDQYIQTIGHSDGASLAVKVAMVIGYEFEASNQLRLDPYIAPEGAWTVCTGLTSATIGTIDPAHRWSVDECFEADSRVYRSIESQLKRLHPNWNEASVWTQAATIDFVYNAGIGAYQTSTMRRKFAAGDFTGACNEHPRWNKATINGVLKILPGLKTRRDTVSEICAW